MARCYINVFFISKTRSPTPPIDEKNSDEKNIQRAACCYIKIFVPNFVPYLPDGGLDPTGQQVSVQEPRWGPLLQGAAPAQPPHHQCTSCIVTSVNL
jgi:hypothetical protein